MMDCKIFNKNLSDYIDNKLDSKYQVEDFKKHIEKCEECKIVYENALAIKKALNEIENLTLPSDFHESIMNRIKKEELENNKTDKNILVKNNSKIFRFFPIASIAAAVMLVFIVFRGFSLQLPYIDFNSNIESNQNEQSFWEKIFFPNKKTNKETVAEESFLTEITSENDKNTADKIDDKKVEKESSESSSETKETSVETTVPKEVLSEKAPSTEAATINDAIMNKVEKTPKMASNSSNDAIEEFYIPNEFIYTSLTVNIDEKDQVIHNIKTITENNSGIFHYYTIETNKEIRITIKANKNTVHAISSFMSEKYGISVAVDDRAADDFIFDFTIYLYLTSADTQ